MSTRPLSRLAKTAHYVIARTRPDRLDAVKLNKVLWFADVEHYRRTGRSITGLTDYVRLQNGPVPVRMQEALAELSATGMIAVRRQKVFSYDRFEYVWLQEPDVDAFSPEEIDLLNQAVDTIEPLTASQVSEYTHLNALWIELENGDRIPIGAASVISRAPSQRDLAWARETAEA